MIYIFVLMALLSLYLPCRLLYLMLFNGNPELYYQATEQLTDEELDILKKNYPRERFSRDVYCIQGPLITKTMSGVMARGGFYSYSYYSVGHIKVTIDFLDTSKINQCISSGTSVIYKIIKGRRKNYLIDANGHNLFVIYKDLLEWGACWRGATNNTASQKRNIRMLGQRIQTKREAELLKIKRDEYGGGSSRNNSIRGVGLLLALMLMLPIIMINSAYSNWLFVVIIIMGAVALYCYFIHGLLFCSRDEFKDKVNIFEGQIRVCSEREIIYVGEVLCSVAYPAMMRSIEQKSIQGSIRAVEATYDEYSYEIMNIEGICNLSEIGQQVKPAKQRSIFALLGIFYLLIASGIYYFGQLDRYSFTDIWPWNGYQIQSDYHFTDSEQLKQQLLSGNVSSGAIIQISGELEPALGSEFNRSGAYYWNSDVKALLPVLAPIQNPSDIPLSYAYVTEFRYRYNLGDLKHNFRLSVRPEYYVLAKPFIDYEKELFAIQQQSGIFLRILDQPLNNITYSTMNDAVALLNSISERKNRHSVNIIGQVYRVDYHNKPQVEIWLSRNESHLLKSKINAFSCVLLTLYSFTLLGLWMFSLWRKRRNDKSVS